MAIVGDPVPTVVPSYSRPGGNITGSSFFFHEINAKRLELLKELIPTLKTAGVLMNPDKPSMASVLRAMEATAKAKDMRLRHIAVRDIDELGAAFQQAKDQIEGFTVIEDGLLFANAKRIAELAIQNRLPIMGFREICDAGGLAAYAVDYRQIFRRAAVFVDKIVKGSKPADLPIEQATRFELIINLKTANALGFTIPPSLLTRADEIIE
jgi:putative ABC transport system substrate-binding protein